MFKKLLYLISTVLLLGLSAPTAQADIAVAETLLVDLRADDLPDGDVEANWTNRGTLGNFAPFGTPVAGTVDGLKAVTFDGGSWFEGPTATGGIEGANTRSIEVWALNPDIPGEETMVSWARRGGPDGTNMAFNYGNDYRWGAVGHWGGDTSDMGWWGSNSPAPGAGKWWHLAYTYDGTAARVYVNGEQESVRDPIPLNTHGGHIIRVGAQADDSGAGATFMFTGSIAEVRIHDGVLSAVEIKNNFNLGGPKKAYSPSPPDGATGVLMPLLQWKAASRAESHDVYFGTTPNLGPTNFIQRNPVTITFYYHAAGLTPGQTYYWRIDEVAADGTIYTGDVWSFMAAPVKAYQPLPADKAKFQDPDVDLSWSPGDKAANHDVYFGTNRTDVENGTGDTFKGNQKATTFELAPLDAGVTYYWRIDEHTDTGAKHVGDVWSFTVIPDIAVSDPNLVGWWKLDEGQGSTALDWSGQGNHGTIRGGTQWIEGFDGGGLRLKGVDGYVDLPIGSLIGSLDSTTITTWVNFAGVGGAWQRIFDFGSGTPVYVFLCPRTGTTGPMRLAITTGGGAGESLIDSSGTLPTGWHHVAAVIRPGNMQLYLDGVVAAGGATAVVPSDLGNTSSNWLGRSQYTADGYFTGALDDFRIYDYAMSAAEIPETMRGDPLLAWEPAPADGSTPDIETATPLTWQGGDKAVEHDVYFGTDADAVDTANTSTAEIYRGSQSAASYTPPETLEWGANYYWRIDEKNSDGTTSKGRVWSFTVADYLIVDDFEDYNDFTNRIFQTWIDGFGYTEPPPGNLGNGTGSTVGYTSAPYAETTIVHEGGQSMPMDYNNIDAPWYSEAERTFGVPQNWTRYGVKALTLWYRGLPASTGSVSYDAGTQTYTMTGSGADIWGTSDQFHYAYKKLSGNGSITARVESVTQTDVWAKAGVMIRETLDANSPHAMVIATPDGRIAFQYRPSAGEDSLTTNTDVGAVTLPHWVKLTRTGNTLTAQHSTNGIDWVDVQSAVPTEPSSISIPMNATIYMGLALTSHNAALTSEAQFTNVSYTGTASPAGAFTASSDVGIASNVAEQLYVAIEDTGTNVKAIPHPDPDAVLLDTWQEWNVNLTDFTGVNLASIKKVYLGVGDRDNPQQGGTGSLYIDDIRLYKPRCVPSIAQPDADFTDDCVVDYLDLEVMAGEWLNSAVGLAPDLDADDDVDFADYAELADAWLNEAFWP